MIDPAESTADAAQPAEGELLPVLAAPEPRPIERAYPAPLPAPLIAATGGFLAGIATFVLVRVLRGGGRRRLPLRRRKRSRGIEIDASRSFLVDVHLLKR